MKESSTIRHFRRSIMISATDRKRSIPLNFKKKSFLSKEIIKLPHQIINTLNIDYNQRKYSNLHKELMQKLSKNLTI